MHFVERRVARDVVGFLQAALARCARRGGRPRFDSAIVFTIDRCHQHAGYLALNAREAAVVEVGKQIVV